MHCLMHWLDALARCSAGPPPDEVPVPVLPSAAAPLAIRKAPSASVESIEPRPPRPCEVGRPKGRRRKKRRQSHKFFLAPAAPPTRRHALGRLPTPPPPPENLLLRLHRKLPSAPPASTQEVSESENRPATRGTAHSEVQGDDRGTARCTTRCNVRPIAALHFLLPTGDSRSGRRSLIPNSSPFSRSTRFPFTYRFAARAPCDSKGSECQCGIHRAETASALRSRKTERAAKEKPTPISHIFFSTCCASQEPSASQNQPPTR